MGMAIVGGLLGLGTKGYLAGPLMLCTCVDAITFCLAAAQYLSAWLLETSVFGEQNILNSGREKSHNR